MISAGSLQGLQSSPRWLRQAPGSACLRDLESTGLGVFGLSLLKEEN
jgi:hypothetical protein